MDWQSEMGSTASDSSDPCAVKAETGMNVVDHTMFHDPYGTSSKVNSRSDAEERETGVRAADDMSREEAPSEFNGNNYYKSQIDSGCAAFMSGARGRDSSPGTLRLSSPATLVHELFDPDPLTPESGSNRRAGLEEMQDNSADEAHSVSMPLSAGRNSPGKVVIDDSLAHENGRSQREGDDGLNLAATNTERSPHHSVVSAKPHLYPWTSAQTQSHHPSTLIRSPHSYGGRASSLHETVSIKGSRINQDPRDVSERDWQVKNWIATDLARCHLAISPGHSQFSGSASPSRLELATDVPTQRVLSAQDGADMSHARDQIRTTIISCTEDRHQTPNTSFRRPDTPRPIPEDHDKLNTGEAIPRTWGESVRKPTGILNGFASTRTEPVAHNNLRRYLVPPVQLISTSSSFLTPIKATEMDSRKTFSPRNSNLEREQTLGGNSNAQVVTDVSMDASNRKQISIDAQKLVDVVETLKPNSAKLSHFGIPTNTNSSVTDSTESSTLRLSKERSRLFPNRKHLILSRQTRPKKSAQPQQIGIKRINPDDSLARSREDDGQGKRRSGRIRQRRHDGLDVNYRT